MRQCQWAGTHKRSGVSVDSAASRPARQLFPWWMATVRNGGWLWGLAGGGGMFCLMQAGCGGSVVAKTGGMEHAKRMGPATALDDSGHAVACLNGLRTLRQPTVYSSPLGTGPRGTRGCAQGLAWAMRSGRQREAKLCSQGLRRGHTVANLPLEGSQRLNDAGRRAFLEKTAWRRPEEQHVTHARGARKHHV